MTTNENAVVTPNAGTPRLARPMVDDQMRARIFGVLFILTFATSIPAAMIFQPVVADPAAYLAGAGSDTLIRLGALLDFLLIIANVGTAVVLYPDRQAAERDPRDRLRHGPGHGECLHRGRNRLRARHRQPA